MEPAAVCNIIPLFVAQCSTLPPFPLRYFKWIAYQRMQRGPPNVFCLVVGQPSSTSRSLGNFDQYVCMKVVLCYQIEIQFTKYFVGCRWYINLLLLLLFSVGHSPARSIAVGHLHPQRDFFQNIFPLRNFFLQIRQVCDTKASWILAVKMVVADSVKN